VIAIAHWRNEYSSTRDLVLPNENASHPAAALAGTHGGAFCDGRQAQIHLLL
jgi:hypothetical protein